VIQQRESVSTQPTADITIWKWAGLYQLIDGDLFDFLGLTNSLETFHARERSYILFSCGTLSFKLKPFNGLLLLLWRVNSTSCCCKKKGLPCQPSANELDSVIPTACQVRSVVVLPKHKEKKLIRGQKSKWSSFTFCKLRSVISHCAGGRSLCTDLPWSLHWVVPWQQGIAPWINGV
jgi:hypothetical protein